MELLCPWEPAKFFIFSSNVPKLLYYSHFIAILAALIFSLILFSKRKDSLVIKIFLFNVTAFIAWSVIDVLLWASNRADLVLFYWNLQLLLETFIYSSALYFSYIFIRKKDLNTPSKIYVVLSMLPIILLLPTNLLLPGIDISYCDAIESKFLIYYIYTYEIILSLFVVFFAIRQIYKSPERRKEIILFAIGIIIYLITFSSGNIIGSFTEDWVLAQVGLFGMPIFIAFLTYSIVKFNLFNIKLISSQALVGTIWLLTLAILFVRKIENVRVIVVFTLCLFTVLGYQLIKSVKREIEIREKIEKLALDLKSANTKLEELNQQKTEFISFASHQLRGPLTSIKGYASLILEGDFGKLTDDIKGAVNTIYQSTQSLVTIVGDYLDVSRIELGRMKYDFKKFDFRNLVKTVVTEFEPNIKNSTLSFDFKDSPGHTLVYGDEGKIKQVISNLIDNSMKYTKKGGLTVELIPMNNKVRFVVSDTGVGISPEVMPNLFEKFSRAPDASKTNILGTGLGLFVAKKMIEAHKGKIWAESEGKDKGSKFIIELDTTEVDTVDKIPESAKNFAKDL